ncbi:DUF3422 family protein [Tropicimonas sediminicola]|uniref:Uncharacterized membrane-anchored protein n=1 Tax=Tropicimonas sediminicola TaxID=1031541 RepID=A0A239GXP3_9RHOB|nr:DUF3422 domain-containing protein [Tropicimonas sediminicola]SNS73293.1 Uncharacterized membrane-anchored protein [Tropicimonas sediminicola]
MNETGHAPLLADHPRRYELANELHARPFPEMKAPCHALFLAIKRPRDAASRDKAEDRAHLVALLDRFGAPHPPPGATHWFGEIGRHRLKWERHTEFSTYTLFIDGLEERAFDASDYELLPRDWLATSPGMRISSALIRVELLEAGEAGDAEARDKVDGWFVGESVAMARLLEDAAIVASDFRIDTSGHMRFALFVRPSVGPSRVGRVVQRVTEIEIYKSMSLLGLPRAQDLSHRMGEIDQQLSVLVGDLRGDLQPAEESLEKLLSISAELENMLASSTFRFGATAAYAALVHDRIAVLREARFEGRQLFGEFMARRFDPAMRTIRSVEARLKAMADRATRAGDLLRTRVDVERQAQNQRLLESMDRRADLALRLQQTVEGLSVVAISYYALNLASYAAYPFLEPLGLSKGTATALLLPIVVLAVFLMVRRIRKGMH